MDFMYQRRITIMLSRINVLMRIQQIAPVLFGFDYQGFAVVVQIHRVVDRDDRIRRVADEDHAHQVGVDLIVLRDVEGVVPYGVIRGFPDSPLVVVATVVLLLLDDAFVLTLFRQGGYGEEAQHHHQAEQQRQQFSPVTKHPFRTSSFIFPDRISHKADI